VSADLPFDSATDDVWVLLDGEWFYRRGRPVQAQVVSRRRMPPPVVEDDDDQAS
jgi:hypothetical protein